MDRELLEREARREAPPAAPAVLGRGSAIDDVLARQQGVGNAAVARLLQRDETKTPAPAGPYTGYGPPPGSPKPPSPEEVLRKCAEELTVIGGRGTEADRQVVIAEVIKIPITALSALRRHKTKIVVCKDSVVDVMPELRDDHPRGWPAGKTWASIPGLHDADGNRVIIATRGGRVPPTGDGHNAVNLVLHEVGHAIGDVVQYGNVHDPEFIKAREADKAKLDAYEGQAGDAGVEETYAESFARFYANDPNDAARYPHLHAYWAGNPFVAKSP